MIKNSVPDSNGQSILAAIEALRNVASHEERNSAFLEIEPVITGIAKQVCSHRADANHVQMDFVEDAPAFIWRRRDHYDTNKGSFTAWTRQVLKNAWAGRWRSESKLKRAPSLEDEVASLPDTRPDHKRLTDGKLDRAAPFSERDLARIESWETRDRLRLLAVAGLWRKVPKVTWENWCRQENVGMPFPPTDCDPEINRERKERIAEVLGEDFGAIQRHWERESPKLKDLDYVKVLADKVDEAGEAEEENGILGGRNDQRKFCSKCWR